VITPHQPDAKYKSTSLIELYRTAPYLHDGRALTLQDVLTTHNSDDQHGQTSGLDEREMSDLIAYLMSL
jgi:cytochrome c peroxidase